uniref:Retrotransposon protein n=1 Tax=Cucumis melo TaxID=3656 RepID=A0A9I9ECF6_CUCME
MGFIYRRGAFVASEILTWIRRLGSNFSLDMHINATRHTVLWQSVRVEHGREMIHESDLVCRQSTYMDRRTFAILCHMPRTVDGLCSTEIVDVEEMVSMFLHILVHDVKNCVIQREFVQSGETVSRHFNLVLLVVRRLHNKLIKKPVSITNNCTDQRWKCFENCLGALDGTYNKVNIPAADRPTFRTRKGKITTNVLGVCNIKGDLRRIRSRLADSTGCPCTTQRIASAKGGQRYRLQEWRGAGNAPTTAKEYFNMKHSSARNLIERAFGLLKGHWEILRAKLYYPLQVQCRIILACCLLHNLINKEMPNCDDIEDFDEEESAYATTNAREHIQYIETTNEWS